MGRATTKPVVTAAAIALLVCTTAAPVDAQEPDRDRVNEILFHAEVRANDEADVLFEDGDFPLIVQQQRIRHNIRPWDEGLAGDLIWMLGNIDYEGERIAMAHRFIETFPDYPDRALPAAEMYWEYRMFVRVIHVLEPDLHREPHAHRNVYTLLSNAYRRLGFDQDVVRVIDVALKHFPDDPAFARNRESALMRIRGGKAEGTTDPAEAGA